VQQLPTPQNQGQIPALFFRHYSHPYHQCNRSPPSPKCSTCIEKGKPCIFEPVSRAETSTDGALASQSDLPPLPQVPSSDPPAATSSYTHPAGDYLPYIDTISPTLPPYPGGYSVPWQTPHFSPTTNYLHDEYLPGPSSQTQSHFSPPTTSYPHDEYLPGPSSQRVPQVEQSYPVPLMPPENYIPCYACGGVYDHGLDCVYYTQ
jgi:hypothetical protein